MFTGIRSRPEVHRGELELTAIDVGQGDSLLPHAFPDGKLMLVDGGGEALSFGHRSKPRIDIGEDVVSPYSVAPVNPERLT